MNLEAVRAFTIAPIEHQYAARDTILYALGLGYGADSLDEAQLGFVYEKALKAVPTMACVLAHPAFRIADPEYRVDYRRLLHAEQAVILHHPLPSAGFVIGETRIPAVEDKGAGRGSLLHQEKTLRNGIDGRLLATVRTTLFLRGDDGQGSFGEPPLPLLALPDRAPDHVLTLPTARNTALIYRLSGDWNPLHVDPGVAQKAGFERPILHGLCTFGHACRALLELYCENDGDRLTRLAARFTSPLFPGETLQFETYDCDHTIYFRARALERDVVVLDRGTAMIRR